MTSRHAEALSLGICRSAVANAKASLWNTIELVIVSLAPAPTLTIAALSAGDPDTFCEPPEVVIAGEIDNEVALAMVLEGAGTVATYADVPGGRLAFWPSWATTEELRRLAVAQGMRTMLREAMQMVEDDVTTIPEVVRTLFAH